jgi:hypothetical protein
MITIVRGLAVPEMVTREILGLERPLLERSCGRRGALDAT